MATQGTRVGHLYYTLGIDRAQLNKIKQELQAVAKAAQEVNKPRGGNGIPAEFKRARDEATKLSGELRRLTKQVDHGTIGFERYEDRVTEIYADLQRLEGEFHDFNSTMGQTAAGAKAVEAALGKTSGAMIQAEGALGTLGGGFDHLGKEFDEIVTKGRTLNSTMDMAKSEFIIAGDQGAAKFRQELDEAAGASQRLLADLNKLAANLNLTEKETKELAAAQRMLTNNIKKSEVETRKVNGSYRGMALGAQMSLGATTLLNDRIFQLSPALGILTNQLMFTTQGLRGFLTAALPVIAVAGSLIAVIGGLYASLKAGVGLEKALEDVRKTTNLTDAELRRLTETVQGLSTELPIATDELLEIARVAGQLGITGVKNIEDFTETIAKLSVATDVTGEQGATNLARFLQATGTEMEQMGGVALQVGNVLNKLENTTAATAAEILKMTSYTQGLASQAGATRTEILGINAAITSLGVKAEAGGSAVVRIVDDIQQAAVNGGNQLANFAEQAGMTTDEFQSLVENSPVEALVTLSEGLGEAAEQGQSLSGILTELGIVEVRERRTLLALAQGHETLKQAISDANTEAIEQLSLNEEVEIQANTTSAKIQRLGNRFMALAQDVGMVLLPAFRGLIDVLTITFEGFSNIVNAAGWLVGKYNEVAFGAENVGEKIDAANEKMEDAKSVTEGATTALGELADVTSESGLIGVLQRMSASIDEDARPAFARFVRSTIQPLLAQDKLQEAIGKTIQHYRKLLEEGKKAELESAESLQAINLQNVQQAQAELDAAESALQEFLENPGNRNPARQLDLEQQAWEARNNFWEAREVWENASRDLSALRGEVAETEALLEELEQLRTPGEMQQWLKDNGFYDPLGFSDDNNNNNNNNNDDSSYTPVEDINQRIREAIALRDKYVATGDFERGSEEYWDATLQAYQRGVDELLALIVSEDEKVTEAMRESAMNLLGGFVLPGRNSARDSLAGMEPFGEDDFMSRGQRENIRAYEELEAIRERQAESRLNREERIRRENVRGYEELQAIEEERERSALAYEERRRREQVSAYEELQQVAAEQERSAVAREERIRRENIRGYEELQELREKNEAKQVRYEERRMAEARRAYEELQRLEEERVARDNTARGGMRQSQIDAMKEEQEASEALSEAQRTYREEMAEIEAQLEAGFITALDAANERVKVQEEYVLAAADAWGWESQAVQNLIRFLNILIRKRKELEGENKDEDKDNRNNEGGNTAFHSASNIISDLSSSFDGIASAIADVTGTVLGEIGEMVDGTIDLKEGIGNIAGAFASLLPKSESVTGQIMEGFFGVAGAVAEFIPGLKGLGPIISGVGTIFTRVLGDMANGIRQMDELVKSTAESHKYLPEAVVEAFREMKTTRVKRDGLLGWLGFTKEGMTEEARKMFDRMVEVGSEVASGFADAFSTGINAFLAGDADWKHKLSESIKSTILNAVINAFIQGAIIKGVFNDFFVKISEMIAEGDTEGALAYANRVLPKLLPVAQGMVEKFVEGIPDDVLPDDDGDGIPNPDDPDTGNKDGSGDSGTRISNITGPTRDLLEDLLRPLNAMQSWTSMIRDIRNDVSRIANATNSSLPAQPRGPQIIVRRDAWMYGKGAESGSNVTIQNATITTNATDARSMARQISRFTHKERRGGK